MQNNAAMRNAQFAMRHPVHIGPIQSPVPGRTDHIPLNVPGGSYVIPADIVSGIGQGNSAAGHATLSRAFGAMAKTGPFGRPRTGGKHFKAGGVSDKDGPVEIMAAGGEFVVPKEAILHLGGGDLRRGHEILDHYVKLERAKLVKTLKKLPGPAKR
jgi:hypothetical protein